MARFLNVTVTGPATPSPGDPGTIRDMVVFRSILDDGTDGTDQLHKLSIDAVNGTTSLHVEFEMSDDDLQKLRETIGSGGVRPSHGFPVTDLPVTATAEFHTGDSAPIVRDHRR